MSFTQIILLGFLIFAFTRVFFRFKDGALHPIGFAFWSILFGSAILLVLFPILSSDVARIVGVGRGADIVLYISVVLLFYLVFRVYIIVADIKRDISELVKQLALRDKKSNSERK